MNKQRDIFFLNLGFLIRKMEKIILKGNGKPYIKSCMQMRLYIEILTSTDYVLTETPILSLL